MPLQIIPFFWKTQKCPKCTKYRGEILSGKTVHYLLSLGLHRCLLGCFGCIAILKGFFCLPSRFFTFCSYVYSAHMDHNKNIRLKWVTPDEGRSTARSRVISQCVGSDHPDTIVEAHTQVKYIMSNSSECVITIQTKYCQYNVYYLKILLQTCCSINNIFL